MSGCCVGGGGGGSDAEWAEDRNMSAIIVCGKRSALFQELPPKRIRCSSSSSPVRLSPSSLLHHLAAFFPDMDNHLLEKALEDCGNDIDSAIRSLNQLRLGVSTPPSLRSTPIASDATLQSQGLLPLNLLQFDHNCNLH